MFNAYTVLTRILAVAALVLSIAIAVKECDIMRAPSRGQELSRALEHYADSLSASASLEDFYWSEDGVVYANIKLSSNAEEELLKLERKLLDIGFSRKKPAKPKNYFKVEISGADGAEKYFFINKSRIAYTPAGEQYATCVMSFDGTVCRASGKLFGNSNLLVEVKPVRDNIRASFKKNLEEGKRREWISKLVSSFQLSASPEWRSNGAIEFGSHAMGEVKALSEKRIAEAKYIAKFSDFYGGHWSGTYTLDGKESRELTLDLLDTYSTTPQGPHLRGVLRLAYGAIAKLNLTAILLENGRVKLSDSNYIAWEAAPYTDGSKRIGGTFIGKMNGSDFSGKWYAEKKEGQKYVAALEDWEERRSVEGFLVGEWLSDWYGSTPSSPTSFKADGSFCVQNSGKRMESEKGSWKVLDSITLELTIPREKILYEIRSIGADGFEFKAKNKNWVPWKGKRGK